MPDKVVYFLGAGFSAPLGLPVMRNFLVKSRDMYSEDSQTYDSFNKVFKEIGELSIIKNFFKSDLFNIEEILSILVMDDRLTRRRTSRVFTEYISQVIDHYTPTPQQPKKLSARWHIDMFTRDETWPGFIYFVANLFNLNFSNEVSNLDREYIKRWSSDSPQAEYSLITVNYDGVLETVLDFLNDVAWGEPRLEFEHSAESGQFGADHAIAYSKLHGSSSEGNIIPPTWDKNLGRKVLPAWRMAYQAISEANHIRIIGYSLPDSDAYVRYLFKSAITSSQHLKQIDAICLDQGGVVRDRYSDFIDFNFYRFANADAGDYLYRGWREAIGVLANPLPVVQANTMENFHNEFMEEHKFPRS